MQKDLKTHTTALKPVRDRFLAKKKINTLYSIAAYARDLGVSASFLSRLLAGERPMTVKLAIQFGSIFDLPQTEIDDWVTNIVSHSSKHAKISKTIREKINRKTTIKETHPIQYYDIEKFKAISQWYHLAILSLTHLKEFEPKPLYIAKKLGISSVEASDAIARLMELGLLEKKSGTLKQTKNMLYVDQTKSNKAVRQYHQQMCEKAKQALEDPSEEAFQEQYFSGISMAFDRKKVPEFKEKLKVISKEMMHTNLDDKFSDLYQLNIQFFPITRKGR